MDQTTAGTPLTTSRPCRAFRLRPLPTSASPYRVLARKYRPRTFDDLIGQEAMVRTLSNAFETGRIAQAWMLTGVRGVGKTTTARILARALNYERPTAGHGRPSDMPELGRPLRGDHGIAPHRRARDGRRLPHRHRRRPRDHRRRPLCARSTARYKVYIIDEVHMLSKKAFNALLKTLEEPPPHAKFIFATTEIRKVPVTILSRCQRFDLRRIEADKLVAHLGRICAAEGVQAEAEALAADRARRRGLGARFACPCSTRPSPTGRGDVTGRRPSATCWASPTATQVIDLFEAVMRGDVPAAFAGLRAQYDAGADPARDPVRSCDLLPCGDPPQADS